MSCKPSCPACHVTFTWRTIAWVINQGFVEAFRQSLTQTDKQSVKTINSCKLELLQSCTSHTHPSRESLLSLSGQANQVRVTVAQQNPQLTELPAVTVTEHCLSHNKKTTSQTLSTSLEASAHSAHLHFQDEALLSAALPKDFHPSLLQVGGQGEGLQGGVPRGTTWARPGAG